MDQLSAVNKARATTFHRWIDSEARGLPTAAFLKKHIRKIETKIKSYDNVNTRKSYYSTLAVIFGKAAPDDKLYKKFSAIATKLGKESEARAAENVAKEGWMPWEAILARAQKIKEDYDAKEKVTKKEEMMFLLSQLYTMIPPLRTKPLQDAKFVSSAGASKRHAGNSIYLVRGNYVIMCRNDKVIRSHGQEEIPLGSPLSQIIKTSLKVFPRAYLLTLTEDKPIAEVTMKKMLSDSLAGIDNLRSAYITFHWSKNISLARKKEICAAMRTSVDNADKAYNKIVEVVSPEEKKEEQVRSRDISQDPNRAKSIAKKTPFNRKEWNKSYQEQNKQKLKDYYKEYFQKNKLKLLARKQVWELASKNIKKPTKKTIEKYQLYEQDGTWKSRLLEE